MAAADPSLFGVLLVRAIDWHDQKNGKNNAHKNLPQETLAKEASSTFIFQGVDGIEVACLDPTHLKYNHYIFGMSTQVSNLSGIPLDQAADLSSRAVQSRLSPAAARAFFRMAHAWRLRDEDARALLGGISNGAFYNLKRRPTKSLDQDRLTRISLLVGIFKGLNILYSRKLADAWMQLLNENPMFGGLTPLAYMLKGGMPAMVRVRQLLDARRGGL
jgi:hypothetical protein